MSTTLPANGAQLFDVAVFNAQVPKEGPKAAPISIPFTAVNTQFVLQQLLTQSGQWMSMVQGLFIDNSSNPEALYITTAVLNQTVKVKPGQMGYIPLLAPKNANVTFTSSGEVTVNVILLNVPVPAQLWDANASAQGYSAVPASTTQVMGLLGGSVGDYLDTILIVPATTSPGAVQIQDGSNPAITIFPGGASSVSNLVPFPVPLGIVSTAGHWTVITGANVSAVVVGTFR